MHGMKMPPKVAVVDSNTLASLGLKNLLANIMPGMRIDMYGSYNELAANSPDDYFHYFVTMNIVLAHLDFFASNRRKTIVMSTSADPESHLDKFHCLCVSVPEHLLIKSLLSLEQAAHRGGKGFPQEHAHIAPQKILSDREIEVLVLIVKGCINKEIADKLNVSLSTIISHRRNITEKLNRKSVGALTIYAVMHGYVNVDDI